jgi:hypothetical protein
MMPIFIHLLLAADAPTPETGSGLLNWILIILVSVVGVLWAETRYRVHMESKTAGERHAECLKQHAECKEEKEAEQKRREQESAEHRAFVGGAIRSAEKTQLASNDIMVVSNKIHRKLIEIIDPKNRADDDTDPLIRLPRH